MPINFRILETGPYIPSGSGSPRSGSRDSNTPASPPDIFSLFAQQFQDEENRRLPERRRQAAKLYHLTPFEPGEDAISKIDRLEAHVAARDVNLAKIETVVRIGVLLFARPSSKLVKDSIDPTLKYLDTRSGKHVDIIRVGYRTREEFSDEDFVRWLELFERETEWKYSGRTDVLIFNITYANSLVKPDYDKAIRITLEEALDDKLFPSAEVFFELLISFASKSDGIDPTWGFSDSLAVKEGKSALLEILLSFVPKVIRPTYKSLRHAAIRTIGRKSQAD